MQCLFITTNIKITHFSFSIRQGNCRRVNSGLECEIGLRRRTYHILCGLVLNVWAKVEDVLASAPHSHSSTKMQVVRLKTHEGTKLVGKFLKRCERLTFYTSTEGFGFALL